jgi:phage terminase large subunit
VLVWHRRAGKDDTAINLIAKKAHERIGAYWRVFPEGKQGRKAIWERRCLRRVIDALPVTLGVAVIYFVY